MNANYFFNGQTFNTFSALCNAYYLAKGYYPVKAYKVDGINLYYQ